MYILFSCSCIPNLALELLQRFGEMLLGLWPVVREQWVMWRTPDPTCRLPSGSSLLPWYLSPSQGRHRVLSTALMLLGGGVLCLVRSHSKEELMQVFSCCLGHVN